LKRTALCCPFFVLSLAVTGILRHTLWYKTLFHRFLNSYRILHIAIITHPLIPPQTAVGANSVRPSKKQAHDYIIVG